MGAELGSCFGGDGISSVKVERASLTLDPDIYGGVFSVAALQLVTKCRSPAFLFPNVFPSDKPERLSNSHELLTVTLCFGEFN